MQQTSWVPPELLVEIVNQTRELTLRSTGSLRRHGGRGRVLSRCQSHEGGEGEERVGELHYGGRNDRIRRDTESNRERKENEEQEEIDRCVEDREESEGE